MKTHELWGGGATSTPTSTRRCTPRTGFEVPVTPGVRLHDLLTVSLNKAGTIDHVVNDTGAPVEPVSERQHDKLRRQLPVTRVGR